jgi:DNA-binding Lrp family transcriptional regulator
MLPPASSMHNARATFAEIGTEVGLSAPAVKRRVDRLVASGAIRGFTALIDPDVLGWQTEAYVEIYCKGTVAHGQLQRSLERVPRWWAPRPSRARPMRWCTCSPRT